MTKLLEGITILDFTQFLSGPSASLRLADFGARVIKVEQPSGDLCRSLYVSNCDIEGESSLFQAINRNKESIVLDLKSAADQDKAQQLVKQADVVLNNFRPGVMAKLGFSYEQVKALNPSVIYGEITGYGADSDWAAKPGQDLLLQALSGLTWASGNGDDGPVPMGVAIADILAGGQLAQGVLAALIGRNKTKQGNEEPAATLVQVSMLEAILDFQFEAITTFHHDGQQPLSRSKTNCAQPLVGGAYGFYATADGHICISMGAIPKLGELLSCPALLALDDASLWFEQREAIKAILNDHLRSQTTQYWLDILEPADIWCADVYNWQQLFEHEGFKTLKILQTVTLANGAQYRTTRCPVRIDGERLYNDRGAPFLGQHSRAIEQEFLES
ncbi:CoA transferase [Neiella sp. HB171785]|uniref:CoA transferase n=1 Tax=Neiella litorisoli TaxID=2771431 RepID=A0A8J6QJ92_9GAMM|nr:CaiB/BaiF CoA-transferase family protein [Neiella litorisoli]MBD1390144.1 CoA transferase [Neiella litorisoli]